MIYSHGELQLSNSRMTRYERTSLLPTVVRYQRRFTPIADLKSDFASPFDEIDTVGVVIDCENVTNESNAANEIVYLADLEQNIVAVTFKSSSKVISYGIRMENESRSVLIVIARMLQSNGFEELLKPKRVIAGVDLRWKGGSLHWKIPVVFACDYSYFTHTPRLKYLHAHLDDFEAYFRRTVSVVGV